MADRYEDEDEFDREDELEDEDGFEDQDGAEDDEQGEDEYDGEVIDFGKYDRQKSEALALRIPVKLNGTVFKFLPPDRWSLSTSSALDGNSDNASVLRWVKGVLPKEQVAKFIDIDPDMEFIGELVKQLQERTLADRKKTDAKNRRSGNPAKRSQAGRGKSARPRR